MQSGSNIPLPDALRTFCQGVLSRHVGSWPPAEYQLAKDFASFSQMDAFLDFAYLVRRCEQLGVRVSERQLPRELRGHNCSFANHKAIDISQYQSFPGAREHTLFHELREILEYEFRALGFPTAEGQELEKRAEQFAILMRTSALENDLSIVLDGVKAIESKWKRWGVYGLMGAFAFIYIAGCTLLPHFEDQTERKSRR